MSTTMKELADRFEVATSTVSRALSGSPGTGKKLTHEIRMAAAQMGYRPKPLRRKNNRTIGLIMGNDQAVQGGPVDPYQLDLMWAVMDVVGEADWHLHSEKVGDDNKLPRLIAENRVDGVILCQHPPVWLCKKIMELGIPAVAMDDTPKRTGLPCVISNVAPSTARVVKLLAEMGHTNIAMVATPGRYPTVQRRINGFVQGLKEAGLDSDDPQIIRVGYSTLAQGQIATRQLLGAVNNGTGVSGGAGRSGGASISSGAGVSGGAGVSPAINSNQPSAIIFATDRLAIGGMLEAARHGLSVPEDISIVGHDNTLLGQGCSPALTSIDMNENVMVREAFEMIGEKVEKKATGKDSQDTEANSTDFQSDSTSEDTDTKLPPTIEISSKVIWRESCGPGARNPK